MGGRCSGCSTLDVDASDLGGENGLCVVLPCEDGALCLGVLAKDKAKKDVEAAEAEEEECGDKSKVVDEVRQDGSSDPDPPAINISICLEEVENEHTSIG